MTYTVTSIPTEEWAKIPEHCRPGLMRYFDLGIPVGDFLSAVLSNDLTRAVLYADDINLPALRSYIHFLHHNAPPMSYGSKDNHDLWIERGGLRGVRKEYRENSKLYRRVDAAVEDAKGETP